MLARDNSWQPTAGKSCAPRLSWNVGTRRTSTAMARQDDGGSRRAERTGSPEGRQEVKSEPTAPLAARLGSRAYCFGNRDARRRIHYFLSTPLPSSFLFFSQRISTNSSTRPEGHPVDATLLIVCRFANAIPDQRSPLMPMGTSCHRPAAISVRNPSGGPLAHCAQQFRRFLRSSKFQH